MDVSDGRRGVALVPLDAPLVHLGGITTALWAPELDPEGPTLMSWALNNHWMVNFKASQGSEMPLCYRLTTHDGPCDDAAAARFGAELATPPIVLRDYLRRGDASGTFLSIPEEAGVLLTAKPADDGDGLIVRLHNVRATAQDVPVQITAGRPASACLTSPLEVDGEPLPLDGTTVRVLVGTRAVQSLRVRL